VADHGSHARHDHFAIADSIGGGTLPATIGTCPACRALHIDLLTLHGAIRAAWAPRRTRDLRLTVVDAARLRRRLWRRMLEMIGTPRDVLTRPLALSFTSLGLVGLLLPAVPAGSSMSAGSAAAPAELNRTMVTAESPAPGATTMAPPSDMAGTTAHVRDRAEPPDPLPSLSIGLLAIGAALFAVRRVARIGVR
jgi:hypothetical protein